MTQITQQTTWEGRPITITWLPLPFEPPLDLVTQAYGICFASDYQILLISEDNRYWNLPGGTVEANETLAETLKREVWEEANADVLDYAYIGCQRIDDPEAPSGKRQYYQTRFWARIALQPFNPQFETIARKLIAPDQFLSTLSWGHVPIASLILEAGLKLEKVRKL
ncbi:MAG: NUDIX hydrolase [Chloroflexota bacterium]